jgi:predicted nucleotidyltransferase
VCGAQPEKAIVHQNEGNNYCEAHQIGTEKTMTSRDEILDLLKSLKSDLSARYKVRSIGVFGSFARKEARADSDVDILVDFKEGADLFDLIELSEYLEEKIGRHVDLATPRALRPEIRDGIFRDVVYA